MWTRRRFLGTTSALGAAFAVETRGIAELEAASAAVAGRSPEEVAQDETYWREIQQAFTLDRTLINFNNGNNCPSPRVVHEAMKRYLDMANMLPIVYRAQTEQNFEGMRRAMAREFGAEPDEIAFTRNASESLQIVQNGIDLRPGDEVITTEQDYPRMLTTWDQRKRRDGIEVTRLQFPVPATGDDLYQRFEKALSPRTKVLHFCHITNLTGQLFPVQRLARLARQRGVLTIVDGAHALAQFPFKLRDLEMDYYGTSLHKWLLAPTGTGLLYVRRERIAGTWPLQAAPARDDADIRKFEAIGTHPAGIRAAIAEALAFHQGIGAERKAARLRYLTMRWADALRSDPRIRIHSSLKPGETWGLALVAIQDVDARALAKFMMDKYRIVVTAIVGGAYPDPQFPYQGLRVTPNVYTTLEEVDTFVEAMQDVLKNGLPAEQRSGG
ncbi:MAG: aminotransferase class V-fold PLP-dependent enzyme [Vicinamibacteria bacterium]